MRRTTQQRFLCLLPLAAVLVLATHHLAIAQEGGFGTQLPGRLGPGRGSSAIGDLSAMGSGQSGTDLGLHSKHPTDIKTLDQVRQLGSNERTLLTGAVAGGFGGIDLSGAGTGYGGGLPGSDLSAPGAGGVVFRGASSNEVLAGLMGGAPPAKPDPRKLALHRIEEAKAKLKSDEDRAQVEPLLKAALAEYFLADMIYRVRELDEIKAKVAASEAKLQKRLDSQQESIELQLKIMLREADGQGFFREDRALETSNRVEPGSFSAPPDAARP